MVEKLKLQGMWHEVEKDRLFKKLNEIIDKVNELEERTTGKLPDCNCKEARKNPSVMGWDCPVHGRFIEEV